jgi:hypothetical protein
MRQSRRIPPVPELNVFFLELCVLVDQGLVCHHPLPELKVFFPKLCVLLAQVLVCHLPLPKLCVPVGRVLVEHAIHLNSLYQLARF